MRTDNDGVAPEDSCRGIRDRRRKGNGAARATNDFKPGRVRLDGLDENSSADIQEG